MYIVLYTENDTEKFSIQADSKGLDAFLNANRELFSDISVYRLGKKLEFEIIPAHVSLKIRNKRKAA